MNRLTKMLTLLIASGVLAVAAGADSATSRYSIAYDEPISGTDSMYGEVLHDDDGEFERWGTAPSWADELQAGFIMPSGGPWLVWMAKLFMSGTGTHLLHVRDACGTIWSAPCGVIDGSIAFTPGYPAPPDRWVTVDLLPLGMMLGGGEGIFVGVDLSGSDDGIALDTSTGTGHTWAFYDGQWQDDSGYWGLQAAIRLVVTDTSFDAESSTWGAIKSLFGEDAEGGAVVLSPIRTIQ